MWWHYPVVLLQYMSHAVLCKVLTTHGAQWNATRFAVHHTAGWFCPMEVYILLRDALSYCTRPGQRAAWVSQGRPLGRGSAL